MSLEIKSACGFTQSVRELFREYTDYLVASDPLAAIVLQAQDFDAELEQLEQKYGLPDGRLYLAWYDDELAGCIGLRKIDEFHCEMKRLYVRPRFRSQHIGRRLAEKIIHDAQEMGYRYILLDTLPFLQDAIRMYLRLGFHIVERYNDNPLDTAVYMELEL